MTTTNEHTERAELIRDLERTAKEIAQAWHNGWGNVCLQAAALLEAQPAEQRVTPEMFKALQDNLDVIARSHNRHVEIGEKYGLNDEAQPAEQTMAVWGEDLRKCRDCADFGPICPNSGKPCGGDQPAILKKQAS